MNLAENALLLGAIGVGLAIAGVGVTYVIDYEKRISLLEARINTLTGIAAVSTAGDVANGAAMPSGAAEPDRTDTVFGQVIAEGCLQLISSYDTIVNSGSIYSAEQERLDALKAQMDALGCTALGNGR